MKTYALVSLSVLLSERSRKNKAPPPPPPIHTLTKLTIVSSVLSLCSSHPKSLLLPHCSHASLRKHQLMQVNDDQSNHSFPLVVAPECRGNSHNKCPKTLPKWLFSLWSITDYFSVQHRWYNHKFRWCMGCATTCSLGSSCCAFLCVVPVVSLEGFVYFWFICLDVYDKNS